MTIPRPQTPASPASPPEPARTAVPSVFFSRAPAQIDDEAELRVTLYVFYALGRRKGYPRFVTARELRAEAPLLASLGDGDDIGAPQARTRLAIAASNAARVRCERGSLLRARPRHAEGAARPSARPYSTPPSDRRALEQIQRRPHRARAALPRRESGAPASKRDNVFQLYEENIGPLTPLVAEELKRGRARSTPTSGWKRRCESRRCRTSAPGATPTAILQRWATEGRTRETAGRDPGEGNSARAQLLRRLPRPATAEPAAPSAETSARSVGGAGFLRRDVPIDHPDFGKAVPCDCAVSETGRRARRPAAALQLAWAR